jgi:RNA polymerase primary sigma factor
MYDVLLNMDTPSPDKGLLNSSLQLEIERSLATLGERESEILRYYFGLNGTRPHTLEEIGEVFGLTVKEFAK